MPTSQSALPLLLFALIAAPAVADPACVQAVAGASVAEAPEAWRVAVARLVRSTADAGHPWSCGGGAVELRVEGKTATLIVVRHGEAPIERELTDADDVVPLGQALLSMPRELAVALEPLPAPVTRDVATELLPANEPPPTRLVLGGRLGARVAGGADAALLGGAIDAAVPLGAWLPAVQVRYGGAVMTRRPGLNELAVGASVARVFAWSSFELRTGLSASAAVMQRDLPRPAGQETRVDARIGAMAAVAMPLTPKLWLVGGLDGEFAPGRGPDKAVQNAQGEAPLPFPFFTVGATLGVEVRL